MIVHPDHRDDRRLEPKQVPRQIAIDTPSQFRFVPDWMKFESCFANRFHRSNESQLAFDVLVWLKRRVFQFSFTDNITGPMVLRSNLIRGLGNFNVRLWIGDQPWGPSGPGMKVRDQ